MIFVKIPTCDTTHIAHTSHTAHETAIYRNQRSLSNRGSHVTRQLVYKHIFCQNVVSIKKMLVLTTYLTFCSHKPGLHIINSERIICCHGSINPLKPELNPICYLLALLGAHHFLHVSRIRVKLLTFRRLLSCIYIWSTHS